MFGHCYSIQWQSCFNTNPQVLIKKELFLHFMDQGENGGGELLTPPSLPAQEYNLIKWSKLNSKLATGVGVEIEGLPEVEGLKN